MVVMINGLGEIVVFGDGVVIVMLVFVFVV